MLGLFREVFPNEQGVLDEPGRAGDNVFDEPGKDFGEDFGAMHW
ncbi:MAG: hypothetical protein WA990_11000 [Rubrobacteraceae bacterium]